MNQGMTASSIKRTFGPKSGLLPGLLLVFAALQAQASNPTVVISSVEEAGEVAPVRVNGLTRSRHDILLPARAEGQLMWTLDEGARVQPGDVLAQIDRRQLEISLQEENQLLERATVNLAYLEGEVARLKALESKNMASRTQLAELVSRRDIAMNDISVAHTRIARIEDNLARTSLVSPIQGVIVERLKERGEYARVGETVVRVVDPAALEITAAVPVINLNRIDFDAPVQVSLPELTFPAELKAVIQAGDQSSQTFEVIVDVPEAMTPNLVSGQFVEVAVPLRTSKLLYVPRDAVVLRSEGSYVFRINTENVAERISVVLGKGRGSMVSILSAEGRLNQGDRVAIRGAENLQDGQQVTPVAS